MAFYRVMYTVVDQINGIHVRSGSFVETDEKPWVLRFGSALKEESFAPNNVDIIKVENTVEGKASKPTRAKPELKEASKLNIPNKAVEGEDVENK